MRVNYTRVGAIFGLQQTFLGVNQEFILSERDEEIGDLAAILLLDFFTEKLASTYYNLGIADAKAMLSEKLDDLHGLEIWRLRKE